MNARVLGKTGLRVSALGLGAGPLGDAGISDAAAEELIRHAVARGITLIDTAPSYGTSEARLGRALQGGLRDRVVLVTKGGYGAPGLADWTPDVIDANVRASLAALATDRLDVFLLHSCDAATLDRMLPALVRARDRGDVRAIGYSGDGEALDAAIASGALDVIECSVNVVDQAALARAIPEATRRGLGVIAKRAFANAAWTYLTRPARADTAAYWERWVAMNHGRPPSMAARHIADMAVRFAAFADGVDCALVGTRHVEHLDAALDAVARGPLTETASIRGAFHSAWPGLV